MGRTPGIAANRIERVCALLMGPTVDQTPHCGRFAARTTARPDLEQSGDMASLVLRDRASGASVSST